MKKYRKFKIVLVSIFFGSLDVYMKHVRNMKHQFSALKRLKENLTEEEILIHVDFAENYACKYGQEIQSCPFDANCKQTTIHTGVIYHGQKLPQPFYSVTKNLDHEPVKIFQHLEPVLQNYVSNDIERIHMLSDAPATHIINVCSYLQ